MLSKKYRLTKNGSFSYLYTHGSRASVRLIKLNYAPSKSGVKIGFSVNNKIGHAVVRNKVKRRMRAIAGELLPLLKPCQLVFVVSVGVDQLSFAEIRTRMYALIHKAGLMRE